ncbi:hypothetical protein ABIA35_003666 [Catenulispora sp. MAP12-49]|uniref:hypothetical protein n=1 Tax=Catenulispora sp. MAP12-49 TaxID=3156302 RepID=UPI003516C009
MVGIALPDEDTLPAGPRRDLLIALHDLYRRAGRPGVRVLAADIKADDDCPDIVSHEGIAAFLRGKRLPRWNKLASLVRVLAKRAVDQPVPSEVVQDMNRLWQRAAEQTEAAGESASQAIAPEHLAAPAGDGDIEQATSTANVPPIQIGPEPPVEPPRPQESNRRDSPTKVHRPRQDGASGRQAAARDAGRGVRARELIALAEKAAVGILAPTGRNQAFRGSSSFLELIGSGFFISEDRVLTSVGIVDGVAPLYLRHGVDTIAVEGVEILKVRSAAVGLGHPWWSDLALLHVPSAIGELGHKFAPVWLDPTGGLTMQASAGCVSLGYDDRGLHGTAELARHFYDVAGVRGGGAGFKYFELTGDEVSRCGSGSMVIDLEAGRVVGILNAIRTADDGFYGLAFPFANALTSGMIRVLGKSQAERILASNDRYHADNLDWPGLCAREFHSQSLGQYRSGGRDTASPLHTATLLGLLADVYDLVTPVELERFSMPESESPQGSVSLLRDLAAAFAATTTPPSAVAVHGLLNFMTDLMALVGGRAGADWCNAAQRWTRHFAADLGQSSRLRALVSCASNPLKIFSE